MDIKIGDLVLIEEGIYKGEKAIVKKTLDDLVGLYVCSNGDSNVFINSKYVTKVENKQYSVQEIFDKAEEGDMFLDENWYNKFIYKNGSIYDYVDDDDITEYYSLGAIMKMKFFKIVEHHSRLKINKKDLDNIVELLRDNGYNYEIEEV